MSQSPQPTNEPNILGQFAGIVGLLGAALYFTGWIYRWAYFGFFKLEVTTLDLPLESFFMVPLQVFFGNPTTIFKTVLAFVSLGMLILLAQLLRSELASILNGLQLRLIRCARRQNWLWIVGKLTSLPKFSPTNFPPSLFNELLLVLLVLFVLFQLARSQGDADAQRDAVNKTSTLPVVTLVAPENNLGLGRRLNDLTDNPAPKNWRIIGDKGLYDDLLGFEVNDNRVWRLLMYRNGLYYVFLDLASDASRSDRPSVLAVRESDGGNQIMILSPEASKARVPK